MVRKTASKPATIDPIALTTAALKAVKSATDYHRLGNTTESETFKAAWDRLTASEQNRIDALVLNNELDIQVIADELAACGSKIQLEAVKAGYGELAIKAAWKLLPLAERDRIKALCGNQTQTQTQEETPPVTETPTIYNVETRAVETASKLAKRNLIELTSDLQDLDNLLDTIDGDIPVELQHAVDELLQERDVTHEALLEKLDNYVALIQSRLLWAASRKAEADRLAKLAESDFKTVDFLKGRLKEHLESTNQKKLRTKRFNISVCANGGKAPLRFDDTTPDQMPEHFQRVQIEANREAIRAALEAGEDLGFAYLAEREYHLRIK